MIMFRFLLLAVVATSSVTGNTRVIGGENTEIEKHPYQVSLQRYEYHVCGGSILKDRIILSAAHCIDSHADSMLVRVGTSRWRQGGSLYRVDSYKYCPGFSEAHFQCDAALIFLQEPISFSISAQPISLVAINERPKEGEMLTTTGWGMTSTEGWEKEDILQEVRVPTIGDNLCARVYANFEVKFNDTMICAGGGNRGSYMGDSGGALINSKRQLVGIVSWGVTDGRIRGKPVVYADVTSKRVRSFIEDNIE